MSYPGDFPPTPQERAAYRLAANADWLARAKERGHASGGAYQTHPEFEKADERLMERDNGIALAAARREIEIERAAHKCYVCGRRDLPRYARGWGIAAAILIGLWIWTGEKSVPLGVLGVLALGGAIGSGLHEAQKPDDEEKLRKEFNEKPHS
jgi:hypothetical protein